jgi:hypothetical protein
MNSSDKTVVIIVGLVIWFATFIASCVLYSNYLDHDFAQRAMESGYEQVWDKEGLRVLWKKSNPSIP